jgi:hypothetical protein
MMGGMVISSNHFVDDDAVIDHVGRALSAYAKRFHVH